MSQRICGGSWNSTGPSRRAARNGSMLRRKTPVASAAFFSRMMCVMRMCAFKANRNPGGVARSEEHTSELQSLRHLVCRLLLEKKMDILLPAIVARRLPTLHVLEIVKVLV